MTKTNENAKIEKEDMTARKERVFFEIEVLIERLDIALNKTSDVEADKELHNQIKISYSELLGFKADIENSVDENEKELKLDKAEEKIIIARELTSDYETSHTATKEQGENFSEIQEKIKIETSAFFGKIKTLGLAIRENIEDTYKNIENGVEETIQKNTTEKQPEKTFSVKENDLIEKSVTPSYKEKIEEFIFNRDEKVTTANVLSFWESADKKLVNYAKDKLIPKNDASEEELLNLNDETISTLCAFVSSSKCTTPEAINLVYTYPYSSNKLIYSILLRKDLKADEIEKVTSIMLRNENSKTTCSKTKSENSYFILSVKTIGIMKDTPDTVIKMILEILPEHNLFFLSDTKEMYALLAERKFINQDNVEKMIEQFVFLISSRNITEDEVFVLSKMINSKQDDGLSAMTIYAIKLLLGIVEIKVTARNDYYYIIKLRKILLDILKTGRLTRLLIAEVIMLDKKIISGIDAYDQQRGVSVTQTNIDKRRALTELGLELARLGEKLKFAKDEAESIYGEISELKEENEKRKIKLEPKEDVKPAKPEEQKVKTKKEEIQEAFADGKKTKEKNDKKPDDKEPVDLNEIFPPLNEDKNVKVEPKAKKDNIIPTVKPKTTEKTTAPKAITKVEDKKPSESKPEVKKDKVNPTPKTSAKTSAKKESPKPIKAGVQNRKPSSSARGRGKK